MLVVPCSIGVRLGRGRPVASLPDWLLGVMMGTSQNLGLASVISPACKDQGASQSIERGYGGRTVGV
jgi:hypothetical protein